MTHKEMVVSHYKGRVGLAGEYLLALRLVLEKYEKKDYTVFCPLCDVGSCNDCPWHVLIDSNCDYMQNIASSELSRYNRMKQIERWIKAYEEALKELNKT